MGSTCIYFTHLSYHIYHKEYINLTNLNQTQSEITYSFYFILKMQTNKLSCKISNKLRT
jgi:hypothetical protein